MDDNEKIRRLAAYVGMRYEEAERFVLAWYLMKTIDGDSVSEWRDISTAPRKYGHYIELRGPSGYSTTKYRIHVGCWGGDFRPGAWVTHSNDRFTDDGDEPSHWRPLS